jgi:hypothetical protein
MASLPCPSDSRSQRGVCIELCPNHHWHKLQLEGPAGPCVAVGTSLHDVLSGPLTIRQHRTLGQIFTYLDDDHDAARDVAALGPMQICIALAEAVKERAQRMAFAKPQLKFVTSPVIPMDFGANYTGHEIVLRYHSQTLGWSRGKLGDFQPASGKYTFLVKMDGESQERLLRLRPGYDTPTSDELLIAPVVAKHTAWNFLVSMLRHDLSREVPEELSGRQIEVRQEADSAAPLCNGEHRAVSVFVDDLD